MVGRGVELHTGLVPGGIDRQEGTAILTKLRKKRTKISL